MRSFGLGYSIIQDFFAFVYSFIKKIRANCPPVLHCGRKWSIIKTANDKAKENNGEYSDFRHQ